MARTKLKHVETITSEEALDRLLAAMEEKGFIHGGESVASTKESLLSDKHSEHWFTDGATEFKILRSNFNGLALFNFRALNTPKLQALFEVVEG